MTIHKEMLNQILDNYIKEKNTDKLAFWITKIEKGYLNFSSESIQNSIASLGGLLFEKYQNLEKQGNYKEAMKGYESIYDSKKYPNRTKAEAAYAVAALYQELNKAKESFHWLNTSLALYEDKDLLKITPALLVLARGYRLLQKFELSSELANTVSKKFCEQAFAEKESFYELLLSNAAIDTSGRNKLASTEESLKDCHLGAKFLEKNQVENFERIIATNQEIEMYNYFEKHSTNVQLIQEMKKYLTQKFLQSQNFKTDKTRDQISKLSILHPEFKLEKVINQYDRVLEFRERIIKTKFTFTDLPKFDEDKYNSELEQYFSIITELNKEAVNLAKESSQEEVALIRGVLSHPYYSLVETINQYVPKGVDLLYLEGFKAGMRQITESLSDKGLQIDLEKVAFFEKNNFFFEQRKHDKFENKKLNKIEKNENNLTENLNYHSALLFSNTIDLVRGQRK
jgi:hypothetical protein